MAIAVTNLATNASSADATSYTTASISPTGGKLIVADVASQPNTGTAAQPSLTGNGLTWTALTSITGAGGRRLTRFIARGASPSAGTLAIDFAGVLQLCCEWSVYEISDVGGTTAADAVVQSNTAITTGTPTSLSVVLPGSTPTLAQDRCISAFRHAANEAKTPRTNWSDIGETHHSNPAGGLETQFRSDAFEATGSASWTTGAAGLAIISEILAGGAQPATVHAVTAVPVPQVYREQIGFGDQWGAQTWGAFPWGAGAGPSVPGGLPIIGRDEFPEELPPLEHVILSPAGDADYPPVVASFGADEEVGYSTLAGAVEAERVRDQPDIYRDGAQWLVVDSSTGKLVAGGDLLTPAFGGGLANLKADGWSKRLQRGGERLMYAARGYDAFMPKNSEPYGSNGRGFYVQGEERFNVTADGALRWHINKGTNSWNTGDRQGFVASWVGLRPGVRRLVGHIHCSVAGPDFKFWALTADDAVGPTHGEVALHDFSGGGADADFDVLLPIAGPVLVIEARRTSDGATGQDLDMTITGQVVYGIADGDQYTGSDVARDIAGRLGFGLAVSDSDVPVLPLDSGADGVFQDPLDLASLLSGCFYRVIGNADGPVMEYRRRGTVLWYVVDPEFPVEPVAQPRYDSVLVPYTMSNGVAQSTLEVLSDVIGQPPLPISRAYGPVVLPDPAPNEANARLLGQQIMAQVYWPRFAGTATFSRVMDREGGFATAHEVHAQDVLVLPLNGGVALTAATLHREGGLAQAGFAEGIAEVDRIVARKVRQMGFRRTR